MADSKVTDLAAQTAHDGDDEIYLYDTSGTADKKSALKNILKVDEALVSSSAIYFEEATLTDAATIAWDVQASPAAKVTLADNRTMGAPSNLKAGATYALRVIQDGTGSRTITWDAVFLWPAATAPTLTTTAAAIDLLMFYCDGTNLYGTSQLAYG